MERIKVTEAQAKEYNELSDKMSAARMAMEQFADQLKHAHNLLWDQIELDYPEIDLRANTFSYNTRDMEIVSTGERKPVHE